MEFNCESPEANIAWDDVMLAREEETFRLWESPVPFVVLGRSGRVSEEVYAEAGVPVLRRSSGGGTVLQGPGCLNYTFVLSMARRPELLSVADSYCVLLRLLVRMLGLPGLSISGSDILLNGKKVSGNAQRRTRGWLLHHGTLLYEAMDLSAVSRVLREPVRRPEHRGERTHAEFLTTLPFAREALVGLLTNEPFEGLREGRNICS